MGSRMSQRRLILTRRISERRVYNYTYHIPERRLCETNRRFPIDRRTGERRQVVNM